MDEATLKSKKVAELKEIAKTFGLEGYAKMKKADLVAALMKDDEPAKPAKEEKPAEEEKPAKAGKGGRSAKAEGAAKKEKLAKAGRGAKAGKAKKADKTDKTENHSLPEDEHLRDALADKPLNHRGKCQDRRGCKARGGSFCIIRLYSTKRSVE